MRVTCRAERWPSACTLHAFLQFRPHGKSDTLFPLTPTLSLGERERRCARVRRLRGPWFIERWEMALSLPKGEGWGEGEVCVRTGRALSKIRVKCSRLSPHSIFIAPSCGVLVLRCRPC